ncbi:MAG TPA: hypothetical protein VGP07_16155 [Polyangia bacterium]
MRPYGWGSCATAAIQRRGSQDIAGSFSLTVLDIDAVLRANDIIVAKAAEATAQREREALDRAKQNKPTF